jgi:hypothetical protein
MIMTRPLSLLLGSWLASVAICGVPAPCQGQDKQPLRLLFLTEPDSPRAEDFRRMLQRRFAAVRVADRWKWDPSLLDAVDVVILDWPQQDGISKWMLNGDKTVKPRLPLGARQQWTMPTVLLGSAGLNLAWAWQVKGGFG